MTMFSILKVDDEYSLNKYPSVGLRIDPSAFSTHQSGVTTSPIDGVSVLVVHMKYFKYLN